MPAAPCESGSTCKLLAVTPRVSHNVSHKQCDDRAGAEVRGNKGAAAVSKAATKNAARKSKAVDHVADGMAALNTSHGGGASAARPQQPQGAGAASAAGGEAGAGMPQELKQARALQKKVRQCQALMDRQDAGELMTGEELAKLDNMGAWLVEIDRLEAVAAAHVSASQ